VGVCASDLVLCALPILWGVLFRSGQQMLVVNAITILVRDAINYLNSGLKLPEWRFEI